MLGLNLAAWDAATWGAAAAWATVALYVVLAVYAVRQVGEARRLREAQVRPFVVVHFEVDWLTEIVVENVGVTVAQDVKISFDPPLESTMQRPWAWEESTLFTDGIPTLPPNKRITVFFDSIIERYESEMPLSYTATVTYRGAGKQNFNERHVLDLGLYKGTSPPPKGLPDLVDKVGKVHEEMRKWTDGISGLRVNASDRDRSALRDHRQRGVERALRVRRQEGNLALLRHLVTRSLQRRGWIR